MLPKEEANYLVGGCITIDPGGPASEWLGAGLVG